ncbi:hypothetical protein EBB07_31595 [Paenibacillaceae bacterium]|nr:hypothetical protein EBB07_31595 [Paenibacillaceae bacterium]
MGGITGGGDPASFIWGHYWWWRSSESHMGHYWWWRSIESHMGALPVVEIRRVPNGGITGGGDPASPIWEITGGG